MPRYLVLSTFDTPTGETVVADDLEAAYDAAVERFGIGVDVEPAED